MSKTGQSLFMVALMLLCCAPSFVGSADEKPIVEQSESGDLEDFEEDISDLLNRWSDIPGGQVSLMYNGTEIYNKAFGMADVESSTLVDTDSRFRIASLSKAVTSAAILTLIEGGNISLDDKMVDLVPHLIPDELEGCDFPNHSTSYSINDITVSQLLNHRGGFDPSSDPTYWHWNLWSFQTNECLDIDGVETEYDNGNLAPISMETILSEWLRRPLDYEPGTQYVYSNIGYQILGQIIEVETGMDYEEYVTQFVLEPMGITGMEIGMTMPNQRAIGEVSYYDYENDTSPCFFPSRQDLDGEPVFDNAPDPDCGGFVVEEKDGGGGWIANTSEYGLFLAHIDGTINSSLFENPFDYFVENPDDTNGGWYGRGVYISSEGLDVWDHNGAFSGSSTRFKRIVTDEGEPIIAVLFINTRPSGTVDGKSWTSDRSTTMTNAMMSVDYANLTLDEGGGDEESDCTPGDTQPADDGCNECVCTENQTWGCSTIICIDDVEEEPTTEESETDEGLPGFGFASALLMLIGTAFFSRRRVHITDSGRATIQHCPSVGCAVGGCLHAEPNHED